MAYPAHMDAFIDLMVEALLREITEENAGGAHQPDAAPAAQGNERDERYPI